MFRVVTRICDVCFLLFCTFLLAAVIISPTQTRVRQSADFPAVNLDYIYDQFYSIVMHFQHREGGYSPVNNTNGHDAFTAYWTQEMQRSLQGFGAYIYRDAFDVVDWNSRPATTEAFNVEVTIPVRNTPRADHGYRLLLRWYGDLHIINKR
ncbi:MAG: hypothetical protein PVS3B3_05180 [Ktedonobacteraceae bacterium]